MALIPGDIPVTREMVHSWVEAWRAIDEPSQTLEEYITAKVNGLGLEDDMVNTSGHDQLGSEMRLADFIIMDLESY